MDVKRDQGCTVKILCVFGKHQYGDPSRGLGTEYAAFVPSLKNLGHDVIHFESWDRRFYPDYRELNKHLLATIERENPHVMLAVQLNYEIWTETLKIIKDHSAVATICWTTDDSWKYREVSRFIGKVYCAMTTTYPDVIPFYYRDGISNVLLTQWAVNSKNLKAPLKAKECVYPVTFVGAAHGNRKHQIKQLRALGVEVLCFGYGWPSGPVRSHDIPEIMRESVISLNFSNASGKGGKQIKARTFEVPGAGGFLLTEYTPGLEAFYTITKEIEIFHNSKELAEKIKYYLTHLDKRDQIALAGYERTRSDHTYEDRLEKVLDFALLAKGNGTMDEPKDLWTSFALISRDHGMNFGLRLLRKILVLSTMLVWGKTRGPRAARRLVFELSWRFFGQKTFTASGWPGRMFPEQ